MPAPITATRSTGFLLELALDDNDGNGDDNESELGMFVNSNASDDKISWMAFLMVVIVIVRTLGVYVPC